MDPPPVPAGCIDHLPPAKWPEYWRRYPKGAPTFFLKPRRFETMIDWIRSECAYTPPMDFTPPHNTPSRWFEADFAATLAPPEPPGGPA